MADQSAALFGTLQHSPGNPAFPTLPSTSDPKLGKIGLVGVGAELLVPFFEQETGVQSATRPSQGFGDWYLNQVIVTPNPIDFGDIADQKDIEVTFFSTYFGTSSLDDIVISTPAIDIIDPVDSPLFPIELNPFSDAVLTFRTEQAGPEQFDDEFEIVVDGATFTVRTVGRRVLLLFGEPENGAIETLVFATDLMRAKDGTEQAFSLRLAPFSNLQYTFRFSAELDSKRTQLEALLVGGNPVLPYGIQLWWEAEKISSAAAASALTVNIDTSLMQINEDETFMFVTPSRVNVFGVVESFTSSSVTFEQPIGTILPPDTYGMPIRYGHLTADPNIATSQKNLSDIAVSLRTESDVDISNVDANYFDFHPSESPSRPIFTARCMRGGRLRGSIRRETQELDSVTGRLFVTGTEPMGEWSSNATVWCNSKQDIRSWREFLHAMRGSWGTFYVPTFQNDLPLDEDITLATNTFVVPYMGIALHLGLQSPYRDLRVRLEDGSVEYKRITLAVDNQNGTETITVDTVFGGAGTSSVANTMISWMHLCRIEGDTARFLHTYLGQAELNFSVRSVLE